MQERRNTVAEEIDVNDTHDDDHHHHHRSTADDDKNK